MGAPQAGSRHRSKRLDAGRRTDNLPPGTYRLRQDLNYGSMTGRAIDVTLYAAIAVVAP